MATESIEAGLEETTRSFYRDVLVRLNQAKVNYLVGGAYALCGYTGIARHTKDLDLFLEKSECPKALEVLERAGYKTELTDSLWLAKAFSPDDAFVDFIFASGNGIAVVDQEWFTNSKSGSIIDVPIRLCPPEETIWSKGFIMERERFDGADVAHYLLICGESFDWDRLLRRFGAHWRVLLSHLVIFGFVYPAQRHIIPSWVMQKLTERLIGEMDKAPSPEEENLCRGTLLSRKFFNIDVGPWGYRDVRKVQKSAAA